jgi:hypothetical protein
VVTATLYVRLRSDSVGLVSRGVDGVTSLCFVFLCKLVSLCTTQFHSCLFTTTTVCSTRQVALSSITTV